MANKPIINLMAMDCPPGEEEQFNKWYNDAHLPENFKCKEMKKAARYKRIGDDNTAPQYIAIYHFDSLKDFEEYDKSPQHLAAAKVPGRPDGIRVRFRTQFELIKSWEK